jgi:predicted RNA-binding Zn-ribbon protein involved in translation (DUF1610 family)
VPSHEEHCWDSLRKYGKRFDELHKWMDEPWEVLGKKHRLCRHDPLITPNEAKQLFGEYADHACLDHIRLDHPEVTLYADFEVGMDTNFCEHWEGDEKAKYCRQCARVGSPCFELWTMVKRLAAQGFVFGNNRPGRAYGNQYRIESPSGSKCYLQMLQGKRTRFALPIEDFLYVARTGKGGMNQTPSKVRQSPFADLLLEEIENDPEGVAIISKVKSILRKDEVEFSFDDSILLGPAEGHYPWKVYSSQKVTSLTYPKSENGQQESSVSAGNCPRCGSAMVWRKARRNGERYRGCTNYPDCTYNERSY